MPGVRPLSIAIIGAGMGGLATAAALRRLGIDVTVYEQAAQFARIGAGIQIGCNAMKVLRKLNLEPRLRAQSFYPRSWNNRDWRTAAICMRRSPAPFRMNASGSIIDWSGWMSLARVSG